MGRTTRAYPTLHHCPRFGHLRSHHQAKRYSSASVRRARERNGSHAESLDRRSPGRDYGHRWKCEASERSERCRAPVQTSLPEAISLTIISAPTPEAIAGSLAGMRM